MASVGFQEWFAVGGAIAAGSLLRYDGKGGYTRKFEDRLARDLGVGRVLTVTGGTSALICALAAAGVGPGDEVLVPAYTWMATAAAPLALGAVPILVEIDDSLTMDPADLAAKITPRSRAVIPVHMVNAPADMDAILAVARPAGLKVIEDACQAVGVRYKGRACGAMGDLGCFSFNGYKNMNIGEGGAVLTSDDGLFARARAYHDLGDGWRGHDETHNVAPLVGVNMRVTEVHGAMLDVQRRKLGPLLAQLKAWRAAMAGALQGHVPLSRHNSPQDAVTLTATFPTAEEAQAFAARRGVMRLMDNSKHVYTNWEAIRAKRTFNPRFDPWAWADRSDLEYGPDACPRTLDILARSCRITLGSKAPPALAPLLARRFLLSA